MQQADSSTIALIGQVIKLIGGHRLLVIVAFRPELVQDWARNENYRELRLERLTDEQTGRLIAEILGKSVPRVAETRLIGWSKGNPLFLRESLRALTDAQALDDLEAVGRITIPPSIGAVISARIDQLAPAAKRVLLAASVLGKRFAVNILSKVSGEAEALVATQLNALVTAEFVRPLDLGTATYGFEHGLFQEVGYATLLRRQRRDLHRSAFLALRSVELNAAPVEDLAHHAYGAELWSEAVPLCREAGRRAAARYANREAAHHFENATAALDHADPERKRLEEGIELRLELRSVSIPLLRLDRIGALLAEANDMAERLGDPSNRAKIAAFLAGHAYLTQQPARCVELCQDALQLSARAPDAGLRIAPKLYLALARYALGEYRRVVAMLKHDPSLQDGALSGAAVGLPVRPLLMRGYWLAISQAELGRFPAALALATEMLNTADKNQPFESLYALTAQGFILLLRGELEAALQSSALALAIAERNDITFIIPVVASQVGFLLATQGRAAEGLVVARRAVRKAKEIGNNAGLSRWCARLSEASLLAGEPAEAREQAENALKIAEENNQLGYLCSALRARAKTRLLDADLDGAAEDLLRATGIARALRLGPALAKCHFDTGALAQVAGRLTEARRAFEVAGKLFMLYRLTAGSARVANALALLERGLVATDAISFFGNAE
jgi:hypothetical protein